MGVDKFNHEGYFDPTTYEALTNIHREEMAADKKAAYLPLVYVCSPYAGDVKTNVKNAKRYSRFAVDENAIPVTPHLLYPQFMDDGNEAERDMVFARDMAQTLNIPFRSVRFPKRKRPIHVGLSFFPQSILFHSFR